MKKKTKEEIAHPDYCKCFAFCLLYFQAWFYARRKQSAAEGNVSSVLTERWKVYDVQMEIITEI